MKTTVTLTKEQLIAVKHHTERTQAHNEQFTLEVNEGKPNHRDSGRLDWWGRILVECPVTGVQSLFTLEATEDAWRSGKRYLYISIKPVDVEPEPRVWEQKKTPPPITRKKTPAKKKSEKKGGGA